MKHLYTIIAVLVLVGTAIFFWQPAEAATIAKVFNGGTGVGTISGLIAGNGTSPFYGVATTTVSCSGSASCTPFVVQGPSPITISATGGAGGAGTVSTSSSETANRVPFWTSTAGTPALLSGGSANFTFTGGNLLSVIGTASSSVFYGFPGSSAAPTYSFTGGTNSGIYLDEGTSPQTLYFVTNGSNVFRANSNSGILSYAPITGLNSKTFALRADSGAAATPTYSFNSDASTGIWSSGASNLNLTTGGVDRLVINSSGNVGIGTTSPYAQLSLGGGNLVLGAATAGGTPGDLFLPKLGTAAGSFLAVDATGKVIATTTPSGGAGTNYFTNSGASTYLSTGTNLGIGTTSPGSTLSVGGNSYTSGFINTSGRTGGYQIDGRLFAFGSTTSQVTVLGIGAGGTSVMSGAGVFTTAIGYNALALLNGGNTNTAVGASALSSDVTGGGNTAVGVSALANNTNHNNSAFGLSALQGSTGGAYNNAFGVNALQNNVNGGYNNAVGGGAIQNPSSTASYNNALGYQALHGTFGNENIGIGNQAGYLNTGSKNIYLGSQPNLSGNGYISSGSNNIGIGYNTLFTSSTTDNQLNIGNFLYGVLPAATSATTLSLPTTGALGVGTSSPFAKLSIQSNNGDTATTLFAIGSSTASATTTLFSISNTGVLTSNALSTSTFATGLNITAGCYAINGACISGGAAFTNTLANGGTATTTFYNGGVVFSDGSKLTQAAGTGNNQFFWNNTSGSLGLGTSTPWAQLSINPNGITGPEFAIGSSTGTSFVVSNGGNVGIGTTTPFATFAVNPVAGAASNQFVVGSSTATNFRIDNSGFIYAPNAAASAVAQTGYWCYDTNGQLIRDTTTCLVSARKFKTKIESLGAKYGLDAVMQIQAVTYFKKNPLGTEDAGQQIGVIADDVEKVLPQLVNHDSTGAVHSFNYEQYTAVLTLAIQQVETQVVAITTHQSEQDKQIAELQAEVKALQAQPQQFMSCILQ
jgi:hypothetical protein